MTSTLNLQPNRLQELKGGNKMSQITKAEAQYIINLWKADAEFYSRGVSASALEQVLLRAGFTKAQAICATMALAMSGAKVY